MSSQSDKNPQQGSFFDSLDSDELNTLMGDPIHELHKEIGSSALNFGGGSSADTDEDPIHALHRSSQALKDAFGGGGFSKAKKNSSKESGSPTTPSQGGQGFNQGGSGNFNQGGQGFNQGGQGYGQYPQGGGYQGQYGYQQGYGQYPQGYQQGMYPDSYQGPNPNQGGGYQGQYPPGYQQGQPPEKQFYTQKELIDDDRNRQSVEILMNASAESQATKDAAKKALEDGRSDMVKLSEELFKRRREKTEPVTEVEREEVDLKLYHLIDKINTNIKKYDKSTRSTRGGSLLFRLLSTALAALVTVLLGIDLSGIENMLPFHLDLRWFTNATALVISAFLTVVSELRAFFDATELNLKYLDTTSKLKQLQDNIDYLQLGGKYVSIDDINLIKLELDKIIDDTNQYILNTRLADESTGSKISKGSFR